MTQIRVNFICGVKGKRFAVEFAQGTEGYVPVRVVRRHSAAHGTSTRQTASLDIELARVKGWERLTCPWCGHRSGNGHKNFTIRCGQCEELVCGAAAGPTAKQDGETGLWFTCPCGARDWVGAHFNSLKAEQAQGHGQLSAAPTRALPTGRRLLPPAGRLLPPPKGKG